MRIKQSLCLPMYKMVDIHVLLKSVAEIGYAAVEFWQRPEDFESIVAEAKHVDELNVDTLSGGRHAHELSPVGPLEPHSRDRLVTVRDDVFHVHVQVRERCELHPEESLDPVFRRRKAGRLLVLDEIVGQMPGEPLDISRVDQVVQASCRSSVIHVLVR